MSLHHGPGPVIPPHRLPNGKYIITNGEFDYYVGVAQVSTKMNGEIVALAKGGSVKAPIFTIEQGMTIQPVPGPPPAYYMKYDHKDVTVDERGIFARKDAKPAAFYIQGGIYTIVYDTPGRPNFLPEFWTLNKGELGAPVSIDPLHFRNNGQKWHLTLVPEEED